MNRHEIIIIGAGAAGLMCAIEAGRRGRQTLVLDHANKPGKKILMSGGGRCNFTNVDVTSANFISQNSRFCISALSRYSPQDFINLVEKHNIPFHEKTKGQLFCDNKSKDILNMLLSECEKHSVPIQLNTSIQNISKVESGFILTTPTEKISCQSVVIATGGLSIPTMGASPFGYQVAEQFGLTVLPTRAGLVPFTLHSHDKEKYSALSGVSAPCHVTCNKQSFEESMLFTHRGLSGPAMLQISSYWNPGDSLSINLLPRHDLYKIFKQKQKTSPKSLIRSTLQEILPKRLINIWSDDTQLETELANIPNQQLKRIANSFKNWHITPNNTEGYRTAEVTLGGVDTNTISSKTFEVKTVTGLYFIGEVLDVTGWLGGYNFQWAWASGYAAGQVV